MEKKAVAALNMQPPNPSLAGIFSLLIALFFIFNMCSVVLYFLFVVAAFDNSSKYINLSM